ncbi:fibrinogen-like protein 1-like protein [Brachyhypopomus gauderio]|uniref:fibrinogen-like protein 1-like protein n=1 Tax=Brachyhypopomus gauderio TaxID=698409 RepID=UPI0040420838
MIHCRMEQLGGRMVAVFSILISSGVLGVHPPAKNIHLLAPEEHKFILNLGHKEMPRDCYELWESSAGKAPDGVYLIRPADTHIAVYCAMQEGGWTVIQHITVNSSVDFDRPWEEYKVGFGSLVGNHWLGNEHIHQLTSGSVRYKLGIKLVDEDAVTKTGEYDPVLVEGEDSQYRLRLGPFHGTAVDALTLEPESYLHDNQRFTTKDRDNDNYFQNCARLEFQGVAGGGWWYDACAGANLNRRNVIYWQKDCNKEHLCKYAWMMVKPSDMVKIVHSDCKRDEL